MKIEFRKDDKYKALICESRYCRKTVVDGVYALYLSREEYEILNMNETVLKGLNKLRYALNDWPASVELCKSHFKKLLEKHKDELILAVI